MSVIDVSNLTFAYDGSFDNVFENVSFRIDTQWKLGFTGRNGRGKTTFLNLLRGKYEYSGTIEASVEFEYFPFEIKNKNQPAVNVLEEIYGGFEYWQLAREMSMLDVNEDILWRPFNVLSGGEQTKLMLALMFLKENSFMLIDEPTNHLDMNAREILGKYLNGKKGFILVSHDRSLLDKCTDHTLSVNRANIEIQKGNFSSWQENKKRADNFEFAQNNKLKREIKRLNEASKQSAAWSDKTENTKYGSKNSGLRPDRGFIGHKSAKMMKKAGNISKRREKAIEEKAGLLKNTETTENLKISPLKFHSEILAEIKNLSLFYGKTQICNNINFTVKSGEQNILSGKNGSGKSSVLKLICGENIKYTGDFYKAHGLVISYVPQDSSFLCGTLEKYAENRNIDETLLKSILRKLDFSRGQFEKDMKTYSAGQKKKVLIAASLCERAHLYVWDEPLNYIDVFSRMQIEELINKFKPTMLMVEHDRAFAAATCAEILTIGC